MLGFFILRGTGGQIAVGAITVIATAALKIVSRVRVSSSIMFAVAKL